MRLTDFKEGYLYRYIVYLKSGELDFDACCECTDSEDNTFDDVVVTDNYENKLITNWDIDSQKDADHFVELGHKSEFPEYFL